VGKIVVTEFMSVDGIIQAPGPDGSTYKYAGWTSEFNRGEAGEKFKLNETLDSEALLLGRKTYESFAKAWPTFKGEFADKFNSMPKYVISSTLDLAEWNNTTILKGELVAEVSQLKQQVAGTIVVHGSSQLVQGLIEHDLVDELRLMVYPIILGNGKRLFGDTSDKKKLRLADSQVMGDGVIVLTYLSDPSAGA
jgi:dihydrofolate reductase